MNYNRFKLLSNETKHNENIEKRDLLLRAIQNFMNLVGFIYIQRRINQKVIQILFYLLKLFDHLLMYGVLQQSIYVVHTPHAYTQYMMIKF